MPISTNHLPPIIGIVGFHGSGKDSVAQYLQETYNYHHISLSDILRVYIKQHNLGAETRPLLFKTGNDLRKKYGAGYLAEHALNTPHDVLVVSSIRNPAELETLKQAGGIIIEIYAKPSVRYNRLHQRGRGGDDITFEEFLRQEKQELQSDDINSQQLEAVITQADYRIENNGTLDELHANMEKVLNKSGIN